MHHPPSSFDKAAKEGKELRKAYRNNDFYDHVVAAHLVQKLGPKAAKELKAKNAVHLLSLCGFESQIGMSPEAADRTESQAQSWSPWCDVFQDLGDELEEEMWSRYSYVYDVKKYYEKGQGNKVSENIGVSGTNHHRCKSGVDSFWWLS